jgi:hypothetical protein
MLTQASPQFKMSFLRCVWSLVLRMSLVFCVLTLTLCTGASGSFNAEGCDVCIDTFLGGSYGDGELATVAPVQEPQGVHFDDATQTLFFNDMSTGHVRAVDMNTGVISTVAGSGSSGFRGDGGLATRAAFGNLLGIVSVQTLL